MFDCQISIPDKTCILHDRTNRGLVERNRVGRAVPVIRKYFCVVAAFLQTRVAPAGSLLLERSRKHSLSTKHVTSALEVFLNDMRYINSRFTYLFTYLLTFTLLCSTRHTKARMLSPSRRLRLLTPPWASAPRPSIGSPSAFP